MTTKSFAFPKRERLTSKKEIDTLFLSGEAFFIYPFKILYQLEDAKGDYFEPLKIVISVPKRNFKRANKRNHIRRLIKESYRINKQQLQETLRSNRKTIRMMFVYQIKEELVYQDILPKVIKVLQELEKKLIVTNI
jgi:ribonuclease P protein component